MSRSTIQSAVKRIQARLRDAGHTETVTKNEIINYAANNKIDLATGNKEVDQQAEKEIAQYFISQSQKPVPIKQDAPIKSADASTEDNNKKLTKASSRQLSTDARGKSNIARETRTERTSTPNNGLGDAIKTVANKSAEEINYIEQGIGAFADSVSEDAAERMVDTVADIPNRTLAKFAEKAQAYEGNPEFFQQGANAIAGALFDAFYGSQSE